MEGLFFYEGGQSIIYHRRIGILISKLKSVKPKLNKDILY